MDPRSPEGRVLPSRRAARSPRDASLREDPGSLSVCVSEGRAVSWPTPLRDSFMDIVKGLPGHPLPSDFKGPSPQRLL